MEQAWRWFGPDDPVTLDHVRQAGATGIVTALHHRQDGTVWPDDEVLQRQREIEAAGLVWSVVESIPVPDAIKLGGADAGRPRRCSPIRCARSAAPASRPSATISCRWSTGPAPT